MPHIMQLSRHEHFIIEMCLDAFIDMKPGPTTPDEFRSQKEVEALRQRFVSERANLPKP